MVRLISFHIKLFNNVHDKILQKKTVCIVTKSNFIAHTDPLYRQLNVLKIKDIFKVQILKFHYKLSYGLLPKYFNSYIHKLDGNIECPISLICTQESWTHENVDMSQFLLPNYSLIFENRRLSTHGCLIMYIHDDFAYKDLNQEIAIFSTSTLFESHFIKICRETCTFQKYVIGNVYRLPSYNAEDLSAFTNEYSDLLNRLRTRSKFVYICGDYNIDILKMCSTITITHFLKTLFQVALL